MGKFPKGAEARNPGNIRASSILWEGETTPKGAAWEVFSSDHHGIRALAMVLISYATRRGLRTVRGIISRFAPPKENRTGAYVASVSRELGVKPDAPIDVRDPATCERLTASIIKHEVGRRYPAETVRAACDDAIGDTVP